jgi:hypothetical protein
MRVGEDSSGQGVRITRRSVVGLGLAAAAGLALPASAAPVAAAFVGQSGEPHSGRFHLGLLIAGDEAALRATVEAVRQRTSYRRILRSRSTDRFKVAFATALLDELTARADLRFTAVEIALRGWPAAGAERDRLVLAAARELFADAPTGMPIKLVDNNDAANFGELLSRAGPTARPVSYGLIGNDNLLQVAAFLTSLANGGGIVSAGAAKGRLSAHLKARLSVGEISARALSRDPRFRVRSVSL